MTEQYRAERLQARNMEKFTGVELTDFQVVLYQACRQQSNLGDQELLARILEFDKGDVEKFKACYPQIFNKI